jgi:Tfp pilus assembly protein PilP
MNNTKNTVQTTKSTVNTSIHITKTPTRYKTHTYTNPHITKQFKTTTVQVTKTTVQDIPK